MITLLGVFAASCVLGLLLTRLARACARGVGLVDKPDGRRKMHVRSVPAAGGPAVFVAALVSMAVVAFVDNPLQERLAERTFPLLGLGLASLLICGVGVVDDLFGLRGRHKLLGQVLAVAIVLGFGVVVEKVSLFGWTVDLGLLALPFTAFWLLGAINALNLIDGMDGMSGSIGVITCLAMGGMAVVGQHWAMAAVAVAMSGALLGFLRYNLPPASIFLGDSGSMLIGLVVGFLGIQCSLKGPATIALAAPIALMTIPILDTLLAITRRKLTGRSIYSTDRGHLHHCLQRHGLSNRRALVLVAILCMVTVIGAFASLVLSNELVAVLSAATVVGILIVTRLFGHAEMMLIMHQLTAMASSFVRLRPGGQGRASEVRLQGSGGWNELWRSLQNWARPLSVLKMRLDVNAPAMHEGYHASWDHPDYDPDDPGLWHVAIPLSAQGQHVGRLELTGRNSALPVAPELTSVAKLLSEFEQALAALTLECGNANAMPSNRHQPIARPVPLVTTHT